jgi:hypothetical protein
VVKDVGLYEYAVLSTFKGERITTVGIHENELDVLFLIEVAVLIHKLIVVVIEVLTQLG